jgi:putative MATE family efflux protein
MFKHISRDKAFYRRVLMLSWPVAVQNLIISSMGMLDSFMVGTLGEQYLSGVTLANTVFFVLMLVLFGLQSGSSILIAQYHGKGDPRAINKVLGIGISLSIAVSFMVALAVFLFPRQVYSITTNDPELVAIAADYGRIVAFSMVFHGAAMIYLAAQRSMENPRPGMIILSVSVVISTFLNWVFIFGNLGAPAMGVQGAALATLLARVFELAVTIIFALRAKGFRLQFDAILRPGKLLFKDFFRFSLPVVVNETAWGFGFSVYAVIFGHLHSAAAALAAFTIAMNVERVLSAIYFGVGHAAAILVGKELGAGRRESAYTTGVTMLLLAAGFGIAAAGVMAIFSSTVILPVMFPMWGASPLTVEIGRIMLLIMALSIPFRAFNFCNIVGVLRGGGDAKGGMWIDLISMYGVGLPLAAVAGLVFHAPATMVYLVMSLEEFFKTFPGLWRFGKKKWLRNVTR